VNCGFCGKPFDEDRSLPACRHCPVGSGCGLVRCPHCGYENPGTPGWIAFIRKHLGGSERRRAAEKAASSAVPLPMIHSRN